METISITIEHPDIIGEDRLAEVIGVQKKNSFKMEEGRITLLPGATYHRLPAK
jgi:hypothetical protein